MCPDRDELGTAHGNLMEILADLFYFFSWKNRKHTKKKVWNVRAFPMLAFRPFLPIFQRGESLRSREKKVLSASSREESVPEYQHHLAMLSPRALTMLLPESHGNSGDGQDFAAPCTQTSDGQKATPTQSLRPPKWPLPSPRMAVLFLLDGRMKVGDMRGFVKATSISCSSWIVPRFLSLFCL